LCLVRVAHRILHDVFLLPVLATENYSHYFDSLQLEQRIHLDLR